MLLRFTYSLDKQKMGVLCYFKKINKIVDFLKDYGLYLTIHTKLFLARQIMESFGEFIRHLRKQKGLNQTQLAAMIGLDMSAISKIENSKIKLKEDLLPNLAEVFELDIGLIMEKYFSDKFAKEVYQNKVPVTVFKAAEEKVKYYKAMNVQQTDLNL